MEKVTIALGMTAGAALLGAAYYVSPARSGDLDIPPLLVDGKPQEVLGKVRSVTFKRFLEQVGEAGESSQIMALRQSEGRKNEVIATFSFASDKIMLIRAKAKPVGSDQTELDIVVELPDSRLSRAPELHPYDLKVIASFGDFLATEYLSSYLNGERMANSREMEDALESRIGFDREQMRAFGDRLQLAVKNAYSAELSAFMSRSGESDSAPSDWPTDESDLGKDSAAVYQEEQSALQREEWASAGQTSN